MKKSDKLAVAKAQYKLLSPHVDKWVALNKSKTKIVATGASIAEVERTLEAKKKESSEILYVTPFDQYHSPICR